MMTTNTVQRLSLFFLGIPAFVAITIFLPFAHNAFLVLVVFVFQALDSREMSAILKTKGLSAGTGAPLIASVLTGLAVYLATLSASFGQVLSGPLGILALSVSISLLALLAPAAFAREERIASILPRIGGQVLTYAYTGILGSFCILITSGFEQGAAAILSFVLIVFANDSLAWLFGVTLGRRRGIVPVSPNKSLAGFIGGMSGSVFATFLAAAIFPGAGFPAFLPKIGIGLLIGATVVIGDLVESGFKRSAGVKDSGALIPGRGGFLDSTDSLLFSAPVFVLATKVLGLFGPLF
jgi:phosphatidate cytidylyltransferase